MKAKQNKAQIVDFRVVPVTLLASLVITFSLLFGSRENTQQQLAPRAEFAACLASKGVVMYGSDTCPECQQQKGMFQDDFKRIHYINCDIHQDECTQKGIQGWPTWMYNRQSLPGVQTFQKLALFSGCGAP